MATRVSSINFSSSLDINHLIYVIDVLRECGFSKANWIALGLRLGLLQTTLDEIKHNNSEAADCLSVTLSKWLQRADNVLIRGEGLPSLDSLSDALRAMNEIAAADKLDELRDMVTPNQKKQFLFQQVMMKLNAYQYFPQKLTLQESLSIDNRIKPNIGPGTDNPHHLLYLMLEQIKMANYKFRSVLLYETLSNDDSDVDSDASGDEELAIHPMDSLLVLIHCADNFLRQDIFSKLASCQVAIPLLLPDPPPSNDIILPLWAMRSIVKMWQTKTPQGTSMSHEGRLVDTPVPMISFMRLSHPGLSKSKILNNVISDSGHDYFFNHDCEGSSVERKFVDGLVEACWYLPAGEESDIFDNTIMFTNLHGNASDEPNSRQVKFLLAHSYISFVFIVEKDICHKNLEMFTSCKGKVYFFALPCCLEKKEELKCLVPNMTLIELKSSSMAKLKVVIRKKIVNKMPTNTSQMFQVSKYANFEDFHIVIDEATCKACFIGKEQAEEIMSKVNAIPLFKVKEQMLPLQGPALWQKWAYHNRIEHRVQLTDVRDMPIEAFKLKLKRFKTEIHKKQCSLALNPTLVMSKFISTLLEYSPDIRAYFLQWLKFYLDDHSFKELSNFQEACRKTRNELRKKELTKERRKDLQAILQIQNIELVNSSFGVEHLFRELSQMYQSVMMKVDSSEHDKAKVKHLPKIVADLLLSGQPLEIVDGDAAHIPIKWVQAVLDEVKAQIKNSKVYVLSVLGIQSTGKSTLMNTMFGVRFSVSAGRCTHGVYLQLIKLQTDLQKCDYMLVIDTEGLRAPELDSSQTQQHDNELAALVIGLARMTIVNMFGKVPAEISDILQTAVHAFLRMKKADMQLTPSCQFVHHHVVNVSSLKTSEFSDRFQETLDNMTKLAAKGEHLKGQYDQFSDVISFDNKTDVQNFPSLWEGNLPMAPVNPAYCEAAQKLREKLIQKSESFESLCTLNDFQLWLTTLWNAILKENFVFSFKNTLEFEAFKILDAEYSKWTWRLHSRVIEWESGTVTALKSTGEENLGQIQDEKIKVIHKQLDDELEKIMTDFKHFFENSSPTIAGTMIQWQGQFQIKLQEKKDDHKQKVVEYCKSIADQILAKKKVDEMKKTEHVRIDSELKKLVFENKAADGNKLTSAELEAIKRKFDSRWDEWMKEIKKNYPLPQVHDIYAKIIYCLHDNCGLRIHNQLLVDEEKKNPISCRGQHLITVIIEPGRHLNISKFWHLRNYFLSSDDCQVAQKATNQFLSNAQSYFTKHKDAPYEDHHIVNVVRTLLQNIDDFEKKGWNFTFTINYQIDLILEVAGYALKLFLAVQKKQIEDHPVTYLNSLRLIYKDSFHVLCNAAAQEKALATGLVRLIDEGLNTSIKDQLEAILINDIKKRNKAVLGSKRNLKGHLLLHLLRKKNFDDFKLYFQDISRSYYEYLKEFVRDNYCKNERKRILEIASDILEHIIEKIRTSASSVRQVSLSYWLYMFHERIIQIIQLKKSELDILPIPERGDVESLKNEFLKGLEECKRQHMTKLNEVYQQINTDKIASFLRDAIAGCCEQCIFCNEQCQCYTVEHAGDHQCALHRPICLGGWRDSSSGEMTLESCTKLLAADRSFHLSGRSVRYRDYRSVNDEYSKWFIPEGGNGVTAYWKWFIANFKDDLASLYEYKTTNIPSVWTNLTEDNARHDVEQNYLGYS